MLLHEIHLKGFLSFGPDSEPFALRPLNVLIGPNGSGKSNVIVAVALLRTLAGAPGRTLDEFGDPGDLIWKVLASGRQRSESSRTTLESKRSNAFVTRWSSVS